VHIGQSCSTPPDVPTEMADTSATTTSWLGLPSASEDISDRSSRTIRRGECMLGHRPASSTVAISCAKLLGRKTMNRSSPSALKRPRPKHVSLLLKIPGSNQDLDGIIDLHKVVISQKGHVWFGIVNRRFTDERLAELRSSCQFLYVLQKKGERITMYRGHVTQVAATLSASEKEQFTPPYYREFSILERVKSWVRLSAIEKLDPAELNKLSVVATGTNAAKLWNSMASLMTVQRQAD